MRRTRPGQQLWHQRQSKAGVISHPGAARGENSLTGQQKFNPPSGAGKAATRASLRSDRPTGPKTKVSYPAPPRPARAPKTGRGKGKWQ